jgi:hypothetical protein
LTLLLLTWLLPATLLLAALLTTLLAGLTLLLLTRLLPATLLLLAGLLVGLLIGILILVHSTFPPRCRLLKTPRSPESPATVTTSRKEHRSRLEPVPSR